MNPSSDLVQKLWRLCTVLRKDGITYQQYVTELTYLLFLKMMAEHKREDGKIPAGARWGDLVAEEGIKRLALYRRILADLGDPEKRLDRTVQAVFANAATFIREPVNLDRLVAAIDDLRWFSEARDSFGDLYEGLLQKNAEETKRGAGQYFTPRVLIDLLVRLMQPEAGETIQDPATGTGGFLIAANSYMRAATDDFFTLPPKAQEFQIHHALHGMENVEGVYRLLLMNLFLHGIDSWHIRLGDTLSPDGAELQKADVILTNPPFGPAGGKPSRDDLTVTAAVSSYQLPFVEHCLRALKPGGRAAIVVPDNVLFEDGRGRDLRRMVMDRADLHTILRLPTGIFYAQGVKTNVIFFTKGIGDSGQTERVWIYDLRGNMPAFGKTSPLTLEHFADFETAFGTDPLGRAPRVDQGEEGRFRCFTREFIAARGDNLDITWLRDASNDAEDTLTEPEELIDALMGHLKSALLEIEALGEELAGEPVA
ncbi:type I restriction enzyme M protein [Rhodoblastus acidophilus]|uniref:class I SAM-dependent DNA methyltransferase n=1 Tax=Rhodoblastus acidophilus TaxID=1074 RepID=UPI0022253FCC|nr:type I restriction-modification system subunit M [Rhodoblastus acidophilus]MCW2283168.1 type I restriction enzyme M protein [Rhodoblastus acidophilus]MCW2332029.1 type I restriction enzyme M protein [Rhodoblastus acidophilus]